MEDANSLVYQGQRNSGASAFNQPTLQIGHTPLDTEAARLYQENQINEQRKYAEAKLKEQKKAEALKKLNDIPLSTFALSNKQEIAKDILNYKNGLVQAIMDGDDPTDPTSPAYMKAQEGELALRNKILEADNQKKIIDDAIKTVNADYDNPNPVLDHDKTMAKIDAYTQAPNVDARRAIDPNSLLVRKPKKFDSLEALKGFKIDPYIGSFGSDSPTGGSSGTKLDKVNLHADMKALANNPIMDENYEQGVKAGTWDNRKEYEDWLYQNAENKYTADYKTVKKEPKTTIIDINNGNSEDLMLKLGTGQQKMVVPEYTLSGTDSGKTKTITLDNVVQLDNINSTVNWGSAINAQTGKPIEKEGSFDLVSGAMALPLVKKGTNRILPTDSGTYVYKDDSGTHKITGTQKEINDQLVALGIGEYKPMIFGKAKSGKNQTEVWLPADAATLGTNDKNKALTAAQQAYEIYKKRAEDLNKVEGGQSQDEWNAAWDKLKAGETMVGLDGKTYIKG